jgi:hypothetical protein
MKTHISRFTSLFIIASLIANPLLWAYAAEPADMASKVAQFQWTDPLLPAWVPNQKGIIGSIISTLFDGTGRIYSVFLANIASGVTSNNIPLWNGSQFANSALSDAWSETNVWESFNINQSNWPALDVNGGMRMNGGNWFYLQWNRIYGDNSSALFHDSNNSTATQLIMRDNESTNYGAVYGDGNGVNFWLLDGDSNWSYLANKDNYTQLLINNVGKLQLDNDNLYVWVQQQLIGWNRTGNRYAYTDYVWDDTYTDYGLRVLRWNSWPNTWSVLEHRGSGDFLMNALDNGTLRFRTDNTDRMVIAPTSGNVGIWENPGWYKLQVNGDVRANGWLRTTWNVGWYSDTYAGWFFMSDTTWIRTQSDDSIWTANWLLWSNGWLTVGYGWAWSPTGWAIISGNTGIGTSTPGTVKLRVESASNDPAIYGIAPWANYGVYGQSSANHWVYWRTLNASWWWVIWQALDANVYGILWHANQYSLYWTGVLYNNWRIQTNGQVWANQICNAAGASCVSLPIAAASIDGWWSANLVARFTDADTLGTWVIKDNGTNVGIGLWAWNPTSRLDVSWEVKSDYLSLRPQNGVIEWWEIALFSSNAEVNRNWRIILDNYDQSLRIFRWKDSPWEYTEYAYFQPNKTILWNQWNVGIWVDPIQKLDVSGNAKIRGNVYTDSNYWHGLVWVYSDTRYQWVFAMGDSYKLAADGTTPWALYGIAWTHSNIWGQSKAGLGHQALFMTNGVTQSAIGSGIWTLWNLTAPFMYDQNDGWYYVDPNGVSRLNDIRPNIMYDGQDTNYYVDPNGTTSINTLFTPFIYDRNDTNYYVDPNGVSRLNDIRPNIMYDGQDTTYYVDPNGNTRLQYAEIMNWWDQNLCFHRPWAFASCLKLRTDNTFWLGGWSVWEGAANLRVGMLRASCVWNCF